jgi:hypothetical protein
MKCNATETPYMRHMIRIRKLIPIGKTYHTGSCHTCPKTCHTGSKNINLYQWKKLITQVLRLTTQALYDAYISIIYENHFLIKSNMMNDTTSPLYTFIYIY